MRAAAVRPGKRDDPLVAQARAEARRALEYADEGRRRAAVDKGRRPDAAVAADYRQAVALRRRRQHHRSRGIDKIRETQRDGRLDLGNGRAGHARNRDREAPAGAVRPIEDQRPFPSGDRRGIEHAGEPDGRACKDRITAHRLDRELRREDGTRQVGHQHGRAVAGRGETVKGGRRDDADDGRCAGLDDLHRPDFAMGRLFAREIQGKGRGGSAYLIDDPAGRILEPGGDQTAGAGDDKVGGNGGADMGVVAGTGVNVTGQSRHQPFQHFLCVIVADGLGQGRRDVGQGIGRRIDRDRMGASGQRDGPHFAGKRVAEEVHPGLRGDWGGGLRGGGRQADRGRHRHAVTVDDDQRIAHCLGCKGGRIGVIRIDLGGEIERDGGKSRCRRPDQNRIGLAGQLKFPCVAHHRVADQRDGGGARRRRIDRRGAGRDDRQLHIERCAAAAE